MATKATFSFQHLGGCDRSNERLLNQIVGLVAEVPAIKAAVETRRNSGPPEARPNASQTSNPLDRISTPYECTVLSDLRRRHRTSPEYRHGSRDRCATDQEGEEVHAPRTRPLSAATSLSRLVGMDDRRNPNPNSSNSGSRGGGIGPVEAREQVASTNDLPSGHDPRTCHVKRCHCALRS
jgi:hypothetical protein